MKPRNNFSESESGTAILEFAIAFPVVALILFAICDFSYYSYYKSEMQYITSVAARYVSMHGDISSKDLETYIKTIDSGIKTSGGEVQVQKLTDYQLTSYSTGQTPQKVATCKHAAPVPFIFYHPLDGGCAIDVKLKTDFPVFFRLPGVFSNKISITAHAIQAVQYPYATETDDTSGQSGSEKPPTMQ